MAPRAVVFALVLGSLACADGKGAYSFLAAGVGALSRGRAARGKFAELAAVLGHGSSEARLSRLEDQMRPTFSALPKSRDGGVDQGVARYALHRYFLAHRAWHIRGLAPDGQPWSASTSTAMLRSKLPTSSLELLDRRAGSGGRRLGLRELALLAATVEDLVHSESLELLLMAYETHNISVDQTLQDEEQLDPVIQTYLLYFLLPWTQEGRGSPEDVNIFLRDDVQEAYPGWSNTLLWVKDLKEGIKYQDRAVRNPFVKTGNSFGDFLSVARLAEEIINSIGIFQDIECRDIKNRLLELGDENHRSNGRIPLNKFYASFYTNESFWFTETPEYLRHLGALDDSNPRLPAAIVPNVIYSRSNCLATSGGFHSLCCVNQCDLLMEALERSVARPEASPSLVAELVAALPSDTVAAPRNLSGSLGAKLGSIAARHGGSVPLHGRMFAQWMHHAFPNECPYPRALGSLEAPLSHDEWVDKMNNSGRADQALIRKVIEEANAAAEAEAVEGELDEASIEWVDEEELLTDLGAPLWWGGLLGLLGSGLRLLSMAGATAASAAVVVDSFKLLRRPWSKALDDSL